MTKSCDKKDWVVLYSPLKSEIRVRWEREVLAENFRPWATVSWRVAGSCRCCSTPSSGCSCCSCPSFGSPGSLVSAANPGVPTGWADTARLSSPAKLLLLLFFVLFLLFLASQETTCMVKFG